MTVEDRGRGIARPLRPGVGLAAMRERAGLIGAALEVGPGQEDGTTVSLRVPAAACEEAPVG